jgi:hypothetical protein
MTKIKPVFAKYTDKVKESRDNYDETFKLLESRRAVLEQDTFQKVRPPLAGAETEGTLNTSKSRSELSSRTSKEGYLFKRTVPKVAPIVTWPRRYFLLKDFYFSYCMTANNGKYRSVVWSTSTIHVLLCNIRSLEDDKRNEGRRFCFEINTGSRSYILQGI